jgi:hypothetical protein
VKLSTSPREKELPSFEKYLNESRFPSVKVSEFIDELPPISTKILKSVPEYGPITAPSEFWEL